MLNNVSIQGRFTADPELRTTPNGKSVTSFTLANDQNFKENAVNWLDCVAWGKIAERIAKYFRKGSQAIITGEVQTRQYEDKNGNKRKVTEIVVQNVYFCEKKETSQTETEKPNINIEPATEADFIDDDEPLPF